MRRGCWRFPGIRSAEVHRRLPGTLVVTVTEARAGGAGASEWPAAHGRTEREVPSLRPGAWPRPTCRSSMRRTRRVARLLGRLQEIDPELFSRVVHGLGGARGRGGGPGRAPTVAPARRDSGGHSRGDGSWNRSSADRAAHGRNSMDGSPDQVVVRGRERGMSALPAAARRRARPRIDPDGRPSSPRPPAIPAIRSPRILGVGVERTAGRAPRRGAGPRGDDPGHHQGDGRRAADGRRRGRHGVLRHRRRARGGAQLARDGVRHRRRDPHRRRGPGQRHGQQRLLRPGPRAAARHSAGLHHRPAARHQRADRDDGVAARGRGVPGHRALERARRTSGGPWSGRGISVGRVRARAAGGLARGAHPRRARAGLRHRRAGRRVHQRRRSSSGGKIRHTASLLCAGGHVTSRPRARAPGDAAGRGAAQGTVRRGVRAAGARGRRDRAAEHAGPGGRGARTAGCSRISCTCACRRCWSTPSTRSPAPGYHQRLAGRCHPDRRRRAGHRASWSWRREVFAMPVRVGVPRQGLHRAGGQRGVAADGRCRPGWPSTGHGNWRSAAASAAARAAGPQVEKYLAPVKRWLQDFF